MVSFQVVAGWEYCGGSWRVVHWCRIGRVKSCGGVVRTLSRVARMLFVWPLWMFFWIVGSLVCRMWLVWHQVCQYEGGRTRCVEAGGVEVCFAGIFTAQDGSQIILATVDVLAEAEHGVVGVVDAGSVLYRRGADGGREAVFWGESEVSRVVRRTSR